MVEPVKGVYQLQDQVVLVDPVVAEVLMTLLEELVIHLQQLQPKELMEVLEDQGDPDMSQEVAVEQRLPELQDRQLQLELEELVQLHQLMQHQQQELGEVEVVHTHQEVLVQVEQAVVELVEMVQLEQMVQIIQVVVEVDQVDQLLMLVELVDRV